MIADAAREVAERVARERYGKLLAYLAARSGDVHAAEDALADAFASALVAWPRDGVPAAPDAWLLTAARRRLIDAARRARTRFNAQERLERAARDAQAAFDARAELPDERLALLYACAHPAIPANVRAPLMLQTVLGLDAARIAAAFLVAPAAMGQRLVRAKRTIARAGIPLRLPDDAEREGRTTHVLDAIYAAYTAGWDDAGDETVRGLDEEATWLARYVTAACEDDPEAFGLLALMRFCSSRARARRGPHGEFVPLDAQDPARWDRGAIAEGEELLHRALRKRRIGRYQLEAAIQSAYAVRVFGYAPDRRAILRLHDALVTVTGSVVARVNRAVALAAVAGPDAGLRALQTIDDERLSSYQPYHAARAALLAATGRLEEAGEAYALAAGLSTNESIRNYLTGRRRAFAPRAP